jgi:hypothetical protein
VTSGCNQYRLGGEPAALRQLNGVGVDQLGPVPDDLNPGLFQRGDIG